MANRKCNANRGEKLQRKHCWISLSQRCCLLYPSLPRGKTMNVIFTLVVLQGGWLKVSCKTPGGRGMVKAKIFSPFHSVRAMVDDVKSRLAPCYDIDVFMKRLRCKNINNFGLICVQCEEELLAKVPAADRSLLARHRNNDPCTCSGKCSAATAWSWA